MTGPRPLATAQALCLAALLALPACAPPRQPIHSDPPEARTEAEVRNPAPSVAVKDAELPAPQPAAVQAQPLAKPAVTAEAKGKAAAVKQEAAKQAESSAAPAPAKPETAEAAGEPKPVAAQPEAGKMESMKPEAVKAEAKPEPAPAKPLPSPAAQTDAAQQAATAQQAAVQAAPRSNVVQIASFTTEKNAEASLAWLKAKGYAEARVVRVEQGQTVFHRVQAGPFQDLAAARKALEELKPDWPQAFIPAD